MDEKVQVSEIAAGRAVASRPVALTNDGGSNGNSFTITVKS